MMNFNIFIGVISILIIFTLDQSFSETSENLDDLVDMGFKLEESEQYEEALIYFDKVLEQDPDHVVSLNEKGVVLSELEQFEEAISYFDRALSLEPQNREIQSNWESTYRNLPFDEIEGFAKIQVRDQRDRLIAYIEADHVKIVPHSSSYELLNTFNLKEVITREGQSFNVLERSENVFPLSDRYIPGISLKQVIHERPMLNIISTDMNGFFYQTEDSFIVDWILLSPV